MRRKQNFPLEVGFLDLETVGEGTMDYWTGITEMTYF